MRTVKILIPIHILPHESQSVTTIFFENLLSVLNNNVNTQLIWLVYTPEKLNVIPKENSNEKILDIHNYKNAVEVIQKEKPDLIYAADSWNFVDYALSSAAKIFNIPVFCVVYSNIGIKKNKKDIMKSNVSRFFQNSVPTDTETDTKKFMKRGRFYVYKYLFLLRTKFAIKSERIHTIFTLWKFIFSDTNSPVFANNTVQFLENESLLKERLDSGFNKSNLVVTGNPIYDRYFHKISNQKIIDVKDGVIRILFAPSTLYEHGFWTKKQLDYAVKETISQITKNRKNMSITVKIHPSSSVLSDYELLVHSIDPSIPVHQKGIIEDFLKDCDVVLTFQSSTAEVYALLYKKPVVICNFFDLKGDAFLERGLAIDCKDPSTLLELIHLGLEKNPATEQKRNDFIREFMFKWDGRAGERICDKLLELTEKKDKQ